MVFRIGRVIVHEIPRVVEDERLVYDFDALKKVSAVTVNDIYALLGQPAGELPELDGRFGSHVRSPVEGCHEQIRVGLPCTRKRVSDEPYRLRVRNVEIHVRGSSLVRLRRELRRVVRERDERDV